MVWSFLIFPTLQWYHWCQRFVSEIKTSVVVWTLLDEQWCGWAFSLIFIHIWSCFIIYAALSNIQCKGEIHNGTQDIWGCLVLVVWWIPVTFFPAHITHGIWKQIWQSSPSPPCLFFGNAWFNFRTGWVNLIPSP